MTAFISTHAGALYVVDQLNTQFHNNGVDLQQSLEFLEPVLSCDRYDDLVSIVYEILTQYAYDNCAEPFMPLCDEVNSIAVYLQKNARPKLTLV